MTTQKTQKSESWYVTWGSCPYCGKTYVNKAFYYRHVGKCPKKTQKKSTEFTTPNSEHLKKLREIAPTIHQKMLKDAKARLDRYYEKINKGELSYDDEGVTQIIQRAEEDVEKLAQLVKMEAKHNN